MYKECREMAKMFVSKESKIQESDVYERTVELGEHMMMASINANLGRTDLNNMQKAIQIKESGDQFIKDIELVLVQSVESRINSTSESAKGDLKYKNLLQIESEMVKAKNKLKGLFKQEFDHFDPDRIVKVGEYLKDTQTTQGTKLASQESEKKSWLDNIVQWFKGAYQAAVQLFSSPKIETLGKNPPKEDAGLSNGNVGLKSFGGIEDKLKSSMSSGDKKEKGDSEKLSFAKSETVKPAGLPPSWMVVLCRHLVSKIQTSIRIQPPQSDHSERASPDESVSKRKSGRF